MYSSHVHAVMETSPMAAATMAARKHPSFFSSLSDLLKTSNTASARAEAFLSVEIMVWLPLLHLAFYFHKTKQEHSTFETSTLLPPFTEPCR